MNFTYIDGTLVIDLEAEENISPGETTLVNNTVNTWQSDRGAEEIAKNTKQGKMAERIIEQFFSEFSDGFYCASYDKIRQDDFKKHAPFDEILTRKNGKQNTLYLDCISHIRQDVYGNEYGKITPNTRKLCRASQIYLVEVKSSVINETLMHDASDPADMASLIRRRRTIWMYPRFCRDSDEIKNYEDYARYVYDLKEDYREKGFEHFKEITLPALECEEASDIRIQIFVEYGNDGKATRCYVMGYATCDEIAKHKTITKFPGEKCGRALYMTLPLEKSHRIIDLFHDTRLWGGG